MTDKVKHLEEKLLPLCLSNVLNLVEEEEEAEQKVTKSKEVKPITITRTEPGCRLVLVLKKAGLTKELFQQVASFLRHTGLQGVLFVFESKLPNELMQRTINAAMGSLLVEQFLAHELVNIRTVFEHPLQAVSIRTFAWSDPFVVQLLKTLGNKTYDQFPRLIQQDILVRYLCPPCHHHQTSASASPILFEFTHFENDSKFYRVFY